MEFRAQECILKVAQCGSISKAAQQLYTSQPALSRYIAKLEADLGVAIFDRSKTPIALTPAGKLYATFAEEVLALRANLEESLQALSSYQTGSISVGIPHMRAAYMLPPILAKFREEFPGITVAVMEDSESKLEECILSGEVDIAILPSPLFSRELTSEPIYREALKFTAPKGYLQEKHFSSDGVLFWPEILKLPFALYKKESPLRVLFDGLCRQYNCSEPSIYMETMSTNLLVQLVVGGLGVSILPEYAPVQLCQAEKVDQYALTSIDSFWEVGLVHRHDHRLSYLETKFLDIVRTLFNS